MLQQHVSSSTALTQPGYHTLKRLMDVVFSAALLIVLAPLMLLIALAIKLDSRGPAFFVQERVGSRRRQTPTGTSWEIGTFRFYKFRSMVQNADEALHQAYIQAYTQGHVNVDTPEKLFKLTDDPRITRVGRWLRRSSLDELPQLLNVLKGDMSLVGPRPVPIYEYENYQPWQLERLAALPGITGMWQVKGRCQVSFEEQVQLDIDYVRRQSLRLDLKLLILTLPAVVSGRGAE